MEKQTIAVDGVPVIGPHNTNSTNPYLLAAIPPTKLYIHYKKRGICKL